MYVMDLHDEICCKLGSTIRSGHGDHNISEDSGGSIFGTYMSVTISAVLYYWEYQPR